jgi:mannitol 2-dehydrogenase
MPELNAKTLPTLASTVAIPTYDRAAVRTGIVHVGVGGFHRAHQAMYVDRLMNAGAALDWGICGVGLLPGDAAMRDVMAAQDGLYTLVLCHPDGSWEPRVIGSIVEYLYAPDNPEAVIEKMAGPSTRIVSLTVTEGGYNINHNTGAFDLTTPDVAADLTGYDPPTTVFGLVTEALARRRERGLAPFTIMSCDNVKGNGHVARLAFGTFARAKDAQLGDWIDERGSFPDSMVDRITPRTTDDDRTALAERLGITDGWPVMCEPFVQWVLEDAFVDGRPAFEDAGVQVVADVEPYELMKLRLLNAGHQVLGYFAYLAGYRFVHEACADNLITEFVLAYMDREAEPTLPPVPGVDLGAYSRELIARFSSPAIRDTIARLCTDSSNRIVPFLLPVIRAQLAAGGEVIRSIATVAAWARYAEGVDEEGHPIDVVDFHADERTAAARRYVDDPLSFVRDRTLFGDLADDKRFTTPYEAILRSLHSRGARRTLQRLSNPEVEAG